MSDNSDPLEENILSETQCRKALENSIKSNSFEIISSSLKPMGYQYNGLVTTQYILHISYTCENKEESTQFFVKAIDTSETLLTRLINEMRVYQKETFFYSKLVPLLERVGLSYDFIPDCYLCESPVVVLENLALKSYKPFEKMKNFDVDQCKKCLETIAEFHIRPMIYQYKKSKELGRKYSLLEDFGEELENRYTGQNYAYSKKYFGSSLEALVELVDSLPKNGVDKTFPKEKLREVMQAFGQSEDPEQMACTVLHGDLWATNFLYRLKEQEIDDCLLIDFQTLYYGAPARDVVQFILSTSSASFYKQNKSEILDHYYQYFSKVAAQYDIEPSDLLAEGQFKESSTSYELAAKLIATIDHTITLLPDKILEVCTKPENFENFLFGEKAKFLKEAFDTNESYRQIMTTDLNDLLSMA